MIFWAIVVFVLGLVGILHECCMVWGDIPIFGEATSVVLMLVALGMLFSSRKKKAK